MQRLRKDLNLLQLASHCTAADTPVQSYQKEHLEPIDDKRIFCNRLQPRKQITRGGGFVSRASPYHFFNTSRRSMEREEATGSAAKTRQKATLDLLNDGRGEAGWQTLRGCGAAQLRDIAAGRRAGKQRTMKKMHFSPDHKRPGTLD